MMRPFLSNFKNPRYHMQCTFDLNGLLMICAGRILLYDILYVWCHMSHPVCDDTKEPWKSYKRRRITWTHERSLEESRRWRWFEWSSKHRGLFSFFAKKWFLQFNYLLNFSLLKAFHWSFLRLYVFRSSRIMNSI